MIKFYKTYILFSLIFIIFYQNCSDVEFSIDENSISELRTPNATFEAPPSILYCDFDGKSIKDGETVTAYSNRTTPFGISCNSIERLCRNGVLEGSTSFNFSTCNVESGKACGSKTVQFANKSCEAKLSTENEGIELSFKCNNGEHISSYICEYPYRFDGSKVMIGEASLKATCSAGQWKTVESFNTGSSCYKSGDLYDCYFWIHNGFNGQILRSSDMIRTFNEFKNDFTPAHPAPADQCCSKKLELRECLEMGSGNNSCKAFCVN